MKTDNKPAWMDELADDIETALNTSSIDGDPKAAAIFIAVRPNPDGTKHVIHEIRGKDASLAEAIGSLIYNRDLPGILPLAAAAALQMRHMEDEAKHKSNKPKIKNRK